MEEEEELPLLHLKWQVDDVQVCAVASCRGSPSSQLSFRPSCAITDSGDCDAARGEVGLTSVLFPRGEVACCFLDGRGDGES